MRTARQVNFSCPSEVADAAQARWRLARANRVEEVVRQ